jgi:hypothetical protein
MTDTPTVSPANIELEEKKDNELAPNKEKKRTVGLNDLRIQIFIIFFFSAFQKPYQVR